MASYMWQADAAPQYLRTPRLKRARAEAPRFHLASEQPTLMSAAAVVQASCYQALHGEELFRVIFRQHAGPTFRACQSRKKGNRSSLTR